MGTVGVDGEGFCRVLVMEDFVWRRVVVKDVWRKVSFYLFGGYRFY